MHDDAIETIETEHHTIKICQDTDPINPRTEYDHLGVFVDWHRRYNIGDRKATDQELEALRRGGWPLLRRYMRRFCDVHTLLPVSLLDHSGLHIWIGGGPHRSDSAGWDSGTVGFIYITNENVKQLGTEPIEMDTQVGLLGQFKVSYPPAEACLRAEIEEYDQYLTGDVYGYVIEDAGGEHVDSCWGFFGFDYCVEEAKRAAEYLDEHGQTELERAGLVEVQ